MEPLLIAVLDELDRVTGGVPMPSPVDSIQTVCDCVWALTRMGKQHCTAPLVRRLLAQNECGLQHGSVADPDGVRATSCVRA